LGTQLQSGQWYQHEIEHAYMQHYQHYLQL